MEFLTLYAMVEVAKVTSKGQITLPASIRRKLGLRKGSRLLFLEEGREVRLISGEDLARRLAVFERRAEELGLTRGKVRALVKEAKERLWKEHHAGGG